MEQKHKEISAIILRLANNNKYITSSQIARAKAMYSSDLRNIEEIQKELEEYSAEIEARGIARDKEKGIEPPKDKIITDKQETNNIQVSQPNLEEGIIFDEQLRKNEMESMFNEMPSSQSTISEHHNYAIEPTSKAKTFSMKPTPTINSAGQENIEGLLTLTIIFSIATIVIAFFTLILK